MAKSKTGTFALAFFVFASLFIIIAFVSPYWLVTDGKLKNPKFKKIGKFVSHNMIAFKQNTVYKIIISGMIIEIFILRNLYVHYLKLQACGKYVSTVSKKFIIGTTLSLLDAGGYLKRNTTSFMTYFYLVSS